MMTAFMGIKGYMSSENAATICGTTDRQLGTCPGNSRRIELGPAIVRARDGLWDPCNTHITLATGYPGRI
jgi:hypothetical protein